MRPRRRVLILQAIGWVALIFGVVLCTLNILYILNK